MTPSDEEKRKAFADALKELFKRHPLPIYKYRRVQWNRENDRDTAIRNARSGSPLYMIDVFIDCHVPRNEINAVYALIYQ